MKFFVLLPGIPIMFQSNFSLLVDLCTYDFAITYAFLLVISCMCTIILMTVSHHHLTFIHLISIQPSQSLSQIHDLQFCSVVHLV